jgi:hypothetical protein
MLNQSKMMQIILAQTVIRFPRLVMDLPDLSQFKQNGSIPDSLTIHTKLHAPIPMEWLWMMD